MFTVHSTDPLYNSPMIGNGQVVTSLGPTGYHDGPCPAEETANRTIFWAGRRLRNAVDANIRIPRVPADALIGPTRPLVRFGKLARTLTIDGMETRDGDWQQTLDYDGGAVISTHNHGSVREQTRSLVCLTANVLVCRTRLENRGEEPVRLAFTLAYTFGDAEGFCSPDTRLRIRRPHPDDPPFGAVEGWGAQSTDLARRPPHLRESLSVRYEIDDQLGEVHIGRHPLGEIRQTETGGHFIHRLELQPGESGDLCFWIALGDRLTYTHFPDFAGVQALLTQHERAWAGFWNTSRVEFGDAELEGLVKSSLYTIRCNVSPWSIPPGYLSTIWEGRTFHDEFYPCIALLSSNHADLAEHVPNYRLLTLPLALQRGAGWGAHYAWEATEDGEESAPYGHWTDEEFRHGKFSEAIWRFYLYTGDVDALHRYYPVLRGCAEWLIHDVLVRDEAGLLKTRPITDVDEMTYPVTNSIFVHCATVRALENAARAAEILDVDRAYRATWRSLATELRQTLPLDEAGKRYRYADDATRQPGTQHVPMVFPFSFDVHDERARETLTHIYTTEDAQWLERSWIWTTSQLATAFFYQGRGDEGYKVLCRTRQMTGPFAAPNEHYREKSGPYLPWLTTAAGAFVHAVYAMFVQVVDECGAVLLHGLPSSVTNARFEHLLASPGVTVSGEIRAGRLSSLVAQSERAMTWRFRMPEHYARTARFAGDITVSGADDHGLLTVHCDLEPGDNHLV